MNFLYWGPTAGTICFLLWLSFWWHGAKRWTPRLKEWISVRLSAMILLDLVVVTSFMGTLARAFDMFTALSAGVTLGGLLTSYTVIRHIKNKVTGKAKTIRGPKLIVFIVLFMAAVIASGIFFSFISYFYTVLSTLLFLLPMVGFISITYTIFKKTTRKEITS